MIKLLILIVCAVLWRLGGWDKAKWSGYRDVLIPVLMFLYHWWTCNFLIGLLTGGATNAIRMGYGAYDPEHDDKPSWLASITHDREGLRIRGLYGLLTSFAIGLFPMIYHVVFQHRILAFVGFFFYVAFNTGLEIFINKRKLGDTTTELGNGAGRGLVFFLCR